MKAKHAMSYLYFEIQIVWLELLIWLSSSASFMKVNQQHAFNYSDYSEIRSEFDPAGLSLQN